MALYYAYTESPIKVLTGASKLQAPNEFVMAFCTPFVKLPHLLSPPFLQPLLWQPAFRTSDPTPTGLGCLDLVA